MLLLTPTELELSLLRPHVDDDVTYMLVCSITALLAGAAWGRLRVALRPRPEVGRRPRVAA